jgi:hypothetical protein
LEKPLEEVTIEIPTKPAPITSEISESCEPSVSAEPTVKISTYVEACATSLTEEIIVESKNSEKSDLIEEEKPQELQQQEYHQVSSHAQSLSHLLPANSYAQISPRCYLFSGAEVTLDSMQDEEDDEDDEDEGNTDESDEEEENNEFSDEEETEEVTSEKIIVPDIDNCQVAQLSCEVPVPEISPTPSARSVSSPARSQLECGDRETVETIDANIHNNDENDLEPVPLKKPKLDIEESIF